MKFSRGARLLILGVVLVVVDQVIKYLVKTNMDLGEQIHVIGNWFRLCFVENEGMAFGMKFGGSVGKFLLSLFRSCCSECSAGGFILSTKPAKLPQAFWLGLH